MGANRGRFVGKSAPFTPGEWATEDIRAWLAGHAERLATPGLNVGQIERDKAARLRLELRRRR